MTINVKLLEALATESVADTVMRVLPDWSGSGVMVKLRLPSEPPKARPATETRVGLLESADKTRLVKT